MSLLSRVIAPPATHDLATLVSTVLSSVRGAAPRDLSGWEGDQPSGPVQHAAASSLLRVVTGPSGLGTSAARIASAFPAGAAAATDGERPGGRKLTPSFGLGRLGVAALRIPGGRPADGDADHPGLYCPPAFRDDPGLGEEVNDRLVDWADQVGIYPGQLDRVRAANFGRLMMLTHPATDDPDRLLTAARCVLAEWATDDHFLDEESLGADPEQIGWRLAVTYAAVDPAHLPADYAPGLEQALREEPVAVAYRSSIDQLARYATSAQVARLRHELAVMFMAYNQEAAWRRTGRTPSVWEYLTHRHENSFLPPMVLVDSVAGYELPPSEFADSRVRRAVTLAGSASVVLNDLYSMAKESDADFDLPKLIAAEQQCSPREAIHRTVQIHNELMHTFEAEAGALCLIGSPALRRFLIDIWAWLGGNREWHATTARYHEARSA